MKTIRFLFAASMLFTFSLSCFASGPMYVGGGQGDASARPYRWNNTAPVLYWTSQGGLGFLSKLQADNFTSDCLAVWHNVPTANISFQKGGDLTTVVTAANIVSLLDSTTSELNTKTSIVYDPDGSLTDALYGDGASDVILGFASISKASSDGTNNYFQTGLAVLNGKYINGVQSAEVPLQKFKEVFVHEFGHLIGLDHSQLNIDVLYDSSFRDSDSLAGLPIMFPLLLNTPARPSLAPDDVSAVSRLYPANSFSTTFGEISGHVYFSDGKSAVQGVNVVARMLNSPTTAENESRRVAVSGVSGFLFTGSSGNPITGSTGAKFGSRDKTLIGYYEIPGLPPGTYTLEVESIYPEFVEGSRVGPLGGEGIQIPLPGSCTTREYWNLSESPDDDCSDSSTIEITPGSHFGPNTDILLNDTPPMFDPWEGAWLFPHVQDIVGSNEVAA